MTLNNPLANVLSAMNNNELVSKKNMQVRNNSKVIRKVLDILKAHGYIKSFEVVENGRGGLIDIELAGSINKVGVITPNFACKFQDFTAFEKRFLPARDFGILVISTNKGMMTHKEAKELGLGGKLIAYCY